MAKDVLWDSRAAEQIRNQKLHEHYDREMAHYHDLCADPWASLVKISPQPEYLKHDDLYDVMAPVIQRDAKTIKAMADRKLPQPLGRGAGQWYGWFTHFVVEGYLESVQEGGKK